MLHKIQYIKYINTHNMVIVYHLFSTILTFAFPVLFISSLHLFIFLSFHLLYSNLRIYFGSRTRAVMGDSSVRPVRLGSHPKDNEPYSCCCTVPQLRAEGKGGLMGSTPQNGRTLDLKFLRRWASSPSATVVLFYLLRLLRFIYCFVSIVSTV